VLAGAALLIFAGGVFADGPDGQSRSTFVPRGDAPKAGISTPVVPVQAKDVPKDAPKEPAKKDTAPTMPGLGGRAAQGQDPYDAYIRLEPPGRERLFGTRETEQQLEERMRQERRDAGGTDPIIFPEKPTLTDEPFQTRKVEPVVCLAEPNYVVYRRLYFEEKNAERYGWDLGPVQPFVSSLYFFKDLALFPHNFGSYPCRRFETSAGQCLPGDPVPYLIYPPELTGSGLLTELGFVALVVSGAP
jgi:hypothetical protein